MPIIFTVVFQAEIYKTQVIMLLLQRKMQFATWLTRTAQVSDWLPPKSIANLLLIKGVDFCAQKNVKIIYLFCPLSWTLVCNLNTRRSFFFIESTQKIPYISDLYNSKIPNLPVPAPHMWRFSAYLCFKPVKTEYLQVYNRANQFLRILFLPLFLTVYNWLTFGEKETFCIVVKWHAS